MWEPQWPALRERFRVLRCDLRGFGGSPVGTRPYSHVHDLAELLDHVGVRAPAVVAASYGGKVAVDLALARPERVRGLVLASPALADHDWSPRAESFFAEEEAALGRGDLDAAVELNAHTWGLGAEVLPMVRRALELQQAGSVDEVEPPAARLDRLAAPTLALAGERDLPDFPAIARRIAAEAPAARAEIVPGAGHLLSLDRPEEFLRAVLGFLDA